MQTQKFHRDLWKMYNNKQFYQTYNPNIAPGLNRRSKDHHTGPTHFSILFVNECELQYHFKMHSLMQNVHLHTVTIFFINTL